MPTETEANEVTDIASEASAARDRDELHRMEAGERFDKYVLAGVGGGIYFATVLFKYAIHDGFWAKWLLFSGVLLLLLAAMAIFESTGLLYTAYTLMRDQIDMLMGRNGSTEQPANRLSEEGPLQKLSAIGKRIEFFNHFGRYCLYLGAALLLFSTFAIIASPTPGSHQMNSKPNPASQVQSLRPANELREAATPDVDSQAYLVRKMEANAAKPIKATKDGASSADGRRHAKTLHAEKIKMRWRVTQAAPSPFSRRSRKELGV